nr:lytic transglycosylase domain-containing protein [Candidatus Gracilibacteria bacterium]
KCFANCSLPGINNLPDDLKYLAVAESALIDTAGSGAGAGGLWQFMPDTGRAQGLIINDLVDERRDYQKSTQAAIRYLQYLYGKFNNWALAMAAYNGGHNMLSARMSEQRVSSYYDLVLNPETGRYVYRILAIKYFFENAEKLGYNLEADDCFQWPPTKEALVGEVPDLVTWSHQNKLTLRLLRELNPWILKDSLPAGNWLLKTLN